MGRFWRSLDSAGKITFIALIATLLTIPPGYLALRQADSRDGSSAITQTTIPATVTTTSSITATSSAPVTTQTSTISDSFNVLRQRSREALARYWSLDVDSGRQTDNPDDGFDIQLGSFSVAPLPDAEMARVNGKPNKPETCVNETQRIPEFYVWTFRPLVKSGEQFCIYTDEGAFAIMKVIERHEEPQELVYSITVWKRTGG